MDIDRELRTEKPERPAIRRMGQKHRKPDAVGDLFTKREAHITLSPITTFQLLQTQKPQEWVESTPMEAVVIYHLRQRHPDEFV